MQENKDCLQETIKVLHVREYASMEQANTNTPKTTVVIIGVNEETKERVRYTVSDKSDVGRTAALIIPGDTISIKKYHFNDLLFKIKILESES